MPFVLPAHLITFGVFFQFVLLMLVFISDENSVNGIIKAIKENKRRSMDQSAQSHSLNQ